MPTWPERSGMSVAALKEPVEPIPNGMVVRG